MTFKVSSVALTTTDTPIFETPFGAEGAAHGLVISNPTADAVALTVKFFDASENTTSTLLSEYSVAPNALFSWPKPINLNGGDKIIASGPGLVAVQSTFISEATIARSFTHRGEYVPGGIYGTNDVVSLDGSSYVSLVEGNENTPPGIGWGLYAAKGDAGDAYAHPDNHPASTITQDENNRFVTDAEKAAWNAKQPAGNYATGSGSAEGVNTGDQVLPTLESLNAQIKLVSGVNIKTINNESILGSGNIITMSSVVKKPVVSFGAFYYSDYISDVAWGSTNTSSYGWLIQRTDGVAAGIGQFALVQGGYRTVAQGGAKGTVIPFQINANGAFVPGTPATMWTNSSLPHDFSTCIAITDNKSGGFHYGGNIPWPGQAGHYSGYGYGLINANNTAGNFWNSGTDTTSGIHAGNTLLRGIPDADGTGWYGVTAGYSNNDGAIRQHFCNFGNPAAPIISVLAPGANTSTSPVSFNLLQNNSTSANTAISGVSHWQNSSGQVIARVFGFTNGAYTDYNSNNGWGVYSQSTGFPAIALSDGSVIVMHGSESWRYTAHNVRTRVYPKFPFWFMQSFASYSPRLVPIAANTWIMPSIYGTTFGEMRFSKFVFNLATNTLEYAGESESYATPSKDFPNVFQDLRKLPNNRLLCITRHFGGIGQFVVLDMPTTWVA